MGQAAAINDILDSDDLESVTGVSLGAHGRVPRIISVLNQAGIFHWLNDKGEVVTTWHHVHSAQNMDKLSGHKTPRFDKTL